MAKDNKMNDLKVEPKKMTNEEAKALRASRYVAPVLKLTDRQKREEFRLFWAKEKRKYGKAKDLEEVIWLHLKASKMDEPSRFIEGLKHFGLKRLSN